MRTPVSSHDARFGAPFRGERCPGATGAPAGSGAGVPERPECPPARHAAWRGAKLAGCGDLSRWVGAAVERRAPPAGPSTAHAAGAAGPGAWWSGHGLAAWRRETGCRHPAIRLARLHVARRVVANGSRPGPIEARRGIAPASGQPPRRHRPLRTGRGLSWGRMRRAPESGAAWAGGRPFATALAGGARCVAVPGRAVVS